MSDKEPEARYAPQPLQSYMMYKVRNNTGSDSQTSGEVRGHCDFNETDEQDLDTKTFAPLKSIPFVTAWKK